MGISLCYSFIFSVLFEHFHKKMGLEVRGNMWSNSGFQKQQNLKCKMIKIKVRKLYPWEMVAYPSPLSRMFIIDSSCNHSLHQKDFIKLFLWSISQSWLTTKGYQEHLSFQTQNQPVTKSINRGHVTRKSQFPNYCYGKPRQEQKEGVFFLVKIK